jgi:hypothetical protein
MRGDALMALFDGLTHRIADRANELAEGVRDRIETAITEIPGVRVRREGEALVMEAVGLLRRRISEARLRFAIWSS